MRRGRGQRAKEGNVQRVFHGFLNGAAASALRAASWFHWARKICPSRPPPRLDVHASCRPSGDDTGSPSKPSAYVIRTGSLVPATSTMKTSKFSNPNLFEANSRYSPDGWIYGAQLIDLNFVTCR